MVEQRHPARIWAHTAGKQVGFDPPETLPLDVRR